MYIHMCLNLRGCLARSTCLALLFQRVSRIEYVHRHKINIRVGWPSICEHELTNQPDIAIAQRGALFCVHVVVQSLHLFYSRSVAIQPCPIPCYMSWFHNFHIMSRVAMMTNTQQSSSVEPESMLQGPKRACSLDQPFN